MRKLNIFLILSFLTLVTVPAFALDDTTLDNVVRLRGDGARQGSSTRVLKLVRYDESAQNGTQISSGDALVLSLLSDDGVTVDRSSASMDRAFVGIAAMTIQTSDATTGTSAYDDAGRRNWGWMIVYGPANAKVAVGSATSFSAGDRFVTSGDAASIGSCQTMVGSTTAIGFNVNGASQCASATGGFVLDSGATGDTSEEVYVQAM